MIAAGRGETGMGSGGAGGRLRSQPPVGVGRYTASLEAWRQPVVGWM